MNTEETKQFLINATLVVLRGVRLSNTDRANTIMLASQVSALVEESYFKLEESIQKLTT
jgi:hypothetical protein